MTGWRLTILLGALLALAIVLTIGCFVLVGSGAPVWTGGI
jgi:hypothetical protein